MVSQNRSTVSVRKTAHNQDWNVKAPRTPRSEYRHLRRYMIPTQSTPGTPAAAVIQ